MEVGEGYMCCILAVTSRDGHTQVWAAV